MKLYRSNEERCFKLRQIFIEIEIIDLKDLTTEYGSPLKKLKLLHYHHRLNFENIIYAKAI